MLAGVDDRSSPLFHRFLAKGQFARRFGAPPDELATVDRWLRSEGITPTGVSANRLVVQARAPASVLERALRTELATVRGAGRSLGFANRSAPWVPSVVAGYVTGIVGLDSESVERSSLATALRDPSGRQAVGQVAGRGKFPVACAGAATTAADFGSFTASSIASYYAMTPLHGIGDLGAGVHVAIVEFEPNLASDVSAFQKLLLDVGHRALRPDRRRGGQRPRLWRGDARHRQRDLRRAGRDDRRLPGTEHRPGRRRPLRADRRERHRQGDHDLVGVLRARHRCPRACLGGHFARPGQPPRTGRLRRGGGRSGRRTASATGCRATARCSPSTTRAASPTWSRSAGPRRRRRARSSGTTRRAPAAVGSRRSTACRPTQDNPSVPGVIGTDSTSDPTLCPSGPPYLREVPDVTAVADPNTGYTIYRAASGARSGAPAAQPPSGRASRRSSSPRRTAQRTARPRASCPSRSTRSRRRRRPLRGCTT